MTVAQCWASVSLTYNLHNLILFLVFYFFFSQFYLFVDLQTGICGTSLFMKRIYLFWTQTNERFYIYSQLIYLKRTSIKKPLEIETKTLNLQEQWLTIQWSICTSLHLCSHVCVNTCYFDDNVWVCFLCRLKNCNIWDV